MNERIEKGLELFGHAHGAEAEQACRRAIETGEGLNATHARLSIEFAFGTIWSREALPAKLRSCAVLGMLIALGQTDEIKHHTRMGLANGLTRQEIEEIFLTAIPYCGFPAANSAKTAILEAFAGLDKPPRHGEGDHEGVEGHTP